MRWLVYPLLVLIGPAAAAACPSDLSTLSHDGPVTMTVCPAGDGQSLAEVGSIATVTVLDPVGNPVADLPVSEMALSEAWGPDALLHYCATSAREGFAADAPTDATGTTTFSGTLAAGGWSDLGLTAKLWCGELTVIAETLISIDVRITSPDLNADGRVNLNDFAIFGEAYGTTDWTCDFTHDGTVSLPDFAAFGSHYAHACE
jgi:hypothetical protein